MRKDIMINPAKRKRRQGGDGSKLVTPRG